MLMVGIDLVLLLNSEKRSRAVAKIKLLDSDGRSMQSFVWRYVEIGIDVKERRKEVCANRQGRWRHSVAAREIESCR